MSSRETEGWLKHQQADVEYPDSTAQLLAAPQTGHLLFFSLSIRITLSLSLMFPHSLIMESVRPHVTHFSFSTLHCLTQGVRSLFRIYHHCTQLLPLCQLQHISFASVIHQSQYASSSKQCCSTYEDCSNLSGSLSF